MTFKVTVEAQTRTGEIVSESYLDLIMQACIGRTKRKYKGCKILNTTSRELKREDKCIPEPPEGWRFAMFACKTKKNRWGREVSVPEELNYEPLNGDARDKEKVSIQKS
jgi:hypothetical protein